MHVQRSRKYHAIKLNDISDNSYTFERNFLPGGNEKILEKFLHQKQKISPSPTVSTVPTTNEKNVMGGGNGKSKKNRK